MLSYAVHAENKSLYNTPPVFGIYILGLVLKWLKQHGGLTAIEAVNERKAAKLYAEIDRTGFYRGHAEAESRSRMNVTFRLPSEELEKQFVKESTAAGFDGLKGHRSVGGLRASIYNAFPEEGIDALVAVHAGVRAHPRLTPFQSARVGRKDVSADPDADWQDTTSSLEPMGQVRQWKLALPAAGRSCYRPEARSDSNFPDNARRVRFFPGGSFAVSFLVALLVSSLITQATVFSTTIYLHRTATHRSLVLNPVVEWLFRFWLWVTTGLVVREWVAVHRKHHAFTDEEGDPHSPHLAGFWSVQIGNVFHYIRS